MKATIKKGRTSKTIEFNCSGCGKCCDVPGLVHLTAKEARAMAEYLQTDYRYFRKMHVTRRGRGLILKGSMAKACLFLVAGRCIIYPVRPKQCRTFPFWSETVTNQGWQEISYYCKGAREARIVRRVKHGF